MLNAFFGHSPALRDWNTIVATPPFEIPAEWSTVAAAIHASGRKIVIAVTGGGSGALAALLQTPGASRTILEAVVPYSQAALDDWIGSAPEQSCSAATARAMAVAAYERARRLAPDADQLMWLGVGATASLATDRPKRGERRIHLAHHSSQRTFSGYFSLDGLPADRASDERATAELVLSIIASGCSWPEGSSGLLRASGGGVHAQDPQIELALGDRRLILLKPDEQYEYFADAEAPAIALVFPGSFNPPHAGHLRMAEVAERLRGGSTVTWELSITNVDKPTLDFISWDERTELLRQADADRVIAMTRAPTFREKSELFPNATFIVGVDTLIRIADPKYYNGDSSQRDAAIAEIAQRGCRFLAFGRVMNGEFKVLSDLTLPPALAAICDEVPASEFREDISSTELRSKN